MGCVRGGMCASPFGRRMVDGVLVSNPRYDKLDVMSVVTNGDTPAEYGILSEVLLKAVHNYLYWGLGKNGCTDTKFLDAYDYLFVIRSDNQSTWGSRIMRYIEELPDGKRVQHVDELTDDEMKLRCFDVHYEMLNLNRSMPFAKFLRMLEEMRAVIIEDNRDQVETYLEQEKSREFCRMPRGSQMFFSFKEHDFIKTLTRPDSIRQVEELCMFPFPEASVPRLIRSSRCRSFNRRASGVQRNEGAPIEETASSNGDHHSRGNRRDVSPVQAA